MVKQEGAVIDVSVPCGQCAKPVRIGDDFCEACGVSVSEPLKRALRERLEASDQRASARAKLIKNASNTILVLAALFVLGGVVFYFIGSSKAEDALAQIRSMDAAMPLPEPVAGATTVGELREQIAREPFQVLGLNLFLAAVMAGLFFWSKRALLPAAITALGIYVAVHVANVLYDPSTLAQGLIMKVIITAALVKGVKAALDARALEVAT